MISSSEIMVIKTLFTFYKRYHLCHVTLPAAMVCSILAARRDKNTPQI